MYGLTPIGWQALVTVSGLLGVGLLIVFAMTLARRRREAAPAGDTVKRVPLWVRFGTLAALAVGVLVPAYLGEPYFAAVVLLVTLLGLGEFWDMLAAGGVKAHRWVGWAGAIGLLAAAYFSGLAGLAVALAAFVMVLLPVALFRGDLPSLPARAGGTALGVLYVGLAAVFLLLMRQAPNGFGHVVYYMMVITLVDVFGLVAGVAFGTRPIAPVLSPGKTLEGTVGSALAGVFGGWLFAFAVPELGLLMALAVALVLFAAGLVGDLLASGFKRAVGIKDFSRLLPGHGGILDRFDGYLFAAPVGWALLSWFSR